MNRCRGFTLVELLLALALAALSMVMVGTVIHAFQRGTKANWVLNQQQEAMVRALQQLTEQLREATSISLMEPLVINPDCVEITLPPLSQGQNARKLHFGYHNEGGYVWSGDQERPMCQNVKQLRLQYDQDTHLLHIHLQSEDIIHGSKWGLPLIFETSVILRNAGP